MTSTSEKNVATDHDHVILVDELDSELGTMPKLEAHEKGLLHRAFSVFVFNEKEELLLHKRAADKYHSPGLWTNACCSHPRPGEDILKAAHRRLKEEMGFDCPLEFAFQFIYKSALDNSMTEHELDHVFIGRFSGSPAPNPGEVESWEFLPVDIIREKLESTPESFTSWFRIVFERVLEYRTKP